MAGALGVPESAVRATARDVGGNFGTRNSCYAESVLVAWAARRLGRPVKWRADRREAFLADYHGRDLAVQAELALDADGRFLGFRSTNTSNLGAHSVHFGPLNKGMAIPTTVYRVPAASLRGRSVVTNTSPTTPYRSSGRPEVMFVIERLIDLAARRHGFDRLDLRRKNLVPPSAMPYRNAVGVVYDSGDYQAAFDRATVLADWAGFEDRRAEARRRGRHRGIGVANYIEINTGFPRERAHVTVRPEGAGRSRAGHALVRSGARDELRAAPGRVARRRASRGPPDHRRHRRHRGRRRRALRARVEDGRDRDGERVGPDRGEGPADRRLAPRSGRGGHRVRGATVSREGHRPLGPPVRGGHRGAACRRAGRLPRAARRSQRRNATPAVVSLRHRGVRGRGRSRDGRGRDRALHHGGRLRPRREPDDPARPDARRHRAGRGAGAVGVVRVRPRDRASCCRRR